MGGSKFRALLFVALVLFAPGVAPASGPCRLCSKPVTSPSQSIDGDPIEVAIETNLNFGQLVLAGDGQGAALVRPDGSNGSEGALASVSARAMVGSASVHGLPGRAIRVELPRRIDLYSLSGGRITLDQVVSDLPSLARLDAEGNLNFRFGGRVTVTGESEGDYRGNVPITVEYQ
jgi:Domain of unknown function (DUF4402)